MLDTVKVYLRRFYARLRREPALVGGVITSVVALATAFGLNLSAELVAAVLSLVGLGTGAAVRARVTPAEVSLDADAGVDVEAEDFAAISAELGWDDEGEDA